MNVLIVDVANVYARSAFKLTELSYDGRPTGGLFGFFSSVIAEHRKLNGVTQIFLALEGKNAKKNRQELLADYKADRAGKSFMQHPNDMNIIKLWGSAYGAASVYHDDMEADDVIAFIVDLIDDEQMEAGHTFVLSQDHDMFSLLGPDVTVIRNGKHFTEDDFAAKYGIAPGDYKKLLAIAGDASDNWTGIRGVGEAKATKIILECESDWHRILQHPLVEKRASDVDSAYRAFQWALPEHFKEVPATANEAFLKNFYTTFGMHSLARTVR